MKILLAGGGSGGPVSPVLAVAAEIKKLKPKTEFLFIGTRQGPERAMVEVAGIPFETIPAARWRRFISLKNIFAPIFLLAGFFKSCLIVRKFQPDAVFTAGSFVGVPVCWAGKIYDAKIVVHQQDAQIGLANKLVRPFADYITTALEQTSKDFYSGSGLFERKLQPAAEWIGNPVRQEFLDKTSSNTDFFKLNKNYPVLLVTGGGTGAGSINDLVWAKLPELVKIYQVIHITGKGKNKNNFSDPNYHPYEFLTKAMPDAIKLADIVISRAGMATISELSFLGKVAIIIPMPGTHQEDNAKILVERQAAVVLTGPQATPEFLLKIINKLKFSPKDMEMLSKNMSNLMPKDATEKLAKIIIKHGN